MARIRSIKPEFWTDEKVVELSAFARLLFIGLWNFADDEGRMAWSPKRIKMQIFPSDSVEVSELLGEIRRESLCDLYTVDGIEYLQIVNFSKHQKVDKRTPSRLPPPPDFPDNPPESPRIVPTEGKGREGSKEGASAPSSPGPVFGGGLQILIDTGMQEKTARTFLGMLLADWEEPDVVDALRASVGKADPKSYARKILQGKPKRMRAPPGADGVLAGLRARYGDAVKLRHDRTFYDPPSGRVWNIHGEQLASV